MDENVAKAVREVDLRFTSGNAVPVERASVRDHEWQTIRARLVELEAENERLRGNLRAYADNEWMLPHPLIRDLLNGKDIYSTAHLSENGHG